MRQLSEARPDGRIAPGELAPRAAAAQAAGLAGQARLRGHRDRGVALRAGCTPGDIIAKWAVFGLGATVAGLPQARSSPATMSPPPPHHLHPDSPVYWFLMQAGVIAGSFTTWPVSTWPIRAGIKEASRHAPVPTAAPGGWQ